MIDEAVLEALMEELGDEITVPADGPDQVVEALANASQPSRGERSRGAKPVLAAAAVLAVVAISVPIVHASSGRVSSASTGAPRSLAPASPDAFAGASRTQVHGTSGLGAGAGLPASGASNDPGPSATPPTDAAASSGSGSGPVDGAKIVKTGTLDLQVPHGTLRTAVNRVSGLTVGLGGYVADAKTSYGGTDPTAEITIRVPVAGFESAIAKLHALPGVTVLSDSERGADVTGQSVDLHAQLTAATTERDALLVVLSHAQSIADILAVHDRVAAAQTRVDQLEGQIKTLDDQSSFSSLAATLSEKPAAAKAAVHPKPPTGLAKSWSDARSGFADAVEWLISRSGAALIVVLAALALLFGIRYLYPVVRRGLV